MFERFVVRSHAKEGEQWNKMDFHLVDLEENTMIDEYIPSITCGVGIGVMVNYFDNIYVLGGVYGPEDEKYKLDDHHFYLGASRYSAIDKKWKSIDLPHNSSSTNAAVISGKMYCFGSLNLQLEMLDFEGTWTKLELPSELQGHVLSNPPVTDYEKSRIILHVSDLSQLYAFCPPQEYSSCGGGSTGGTWSMIATDFHFWCNVVGVTDDLICFHEWHYENLLRVFDLRSNKWLQVVADLSSVQIRVRVFDRLFTFPMGKGYMCLVSSLPVRPVAMQVPPSVYFLRFSLLRTKDPSVVKLTPFDYQYYHIPSAGAVSDFVLLQYS